MGDCASRPSSTEVEQHMRDYNAKNDLSFKCIPYERTIDQSIAEDENKRGLEEKLRLYERKKLEYTSKISSMTAGLPPIPELNIEIQKGVNLFSRGLCFTHGQPYVTVQLEPKGPICETYVSDTYKPYWYRLFEIKQSLHNFTSLSFKIWLKVGAKECEFFGSFELNLADLEDQRVKEGWYSLNVENPNKDFISKLRVRVQLIHDEKTLYRSLIESCDQKIEALKVAILKLNGD